MFDFDLVGTFNDQCLQKVWRRKTDNFLFFNDRNWMELNQLCLKMDLESGYKKIKAIY